MIETSPEASERDSAATTLEQIVDEVADATGADPLELPPLYEAADPEAIEALTEHASADSDLRIEFSYADCTVSVRADGSVSAIPAEAPRAGSSVEEASSLSQDC